MTDYTSVIVEQDGGVATITLNQPEKLNPLSDVLLEEVKTALADMEPDDSVKVIRIKGAGRAFCAGADLRSLYDNLKYVPEPTGPEAWNLGTAKAERDRVFCKSLIDQLLDIQSYRKPIVAQVHGFCIAGGTELIGVCDSIFAAADTKFGHPPARAHGLTTTLGMWPFRIGMLKSKELLFTGDLIDGTEAERIGMINKALPPEELDAYTMAYCQRVAQVPLEFLAITKHWINRWFDIAGQRTAASEGAQFNAILHTTPSFHEFVRISEEDGVKAALAWRDGPFRPKPE